MRNLIIALACAAEYRVGAVYATFRLIERHIYLAAGLLPSAQAVIPQTVLTPSFSKMPAQLYTANSTTDGQATPSSGKHITPIVPLSLPGLSLSSRDPSTQPAEPLSVRLERFIEKEKQLQICLENDGILSSKSRKSAPNKGRRAHMTNLLKSIF
ncbi:hypothetical protein K474DRAFT_1674418 [Panus rudis PR-1116 ss-1]|nr:hypothetical protein K474DRAFT_1674418 [Panus rudis PR-1116 ss-1]